MENVNEIKIAVAAGLAMLTALWGWFGWLVVLFVACLLIDYVCGSAIAMKNGAWSSATARAGIWHKTGCIIAVMVAGLADLLIGAILDNLPVALPFSYSVLICPLVVIWYILTEMGSIVEHAVNMGAPVPEFLRRMLAITKDAIDEAGDRMTDGGDDNG